jgi:hypothetical protein
LSWYESDSESNEVSDSYSEPLVSVSASDSEEKEDGDSREILGKDRYVCGDRRQKLSEEHQYEI